MFDDLDPDFLPSPGAALPMVAARVAAVRRRRAMVISGVVGTILLVWVASTAFGGGGKNPDRLTVSRRVTTTSESPTTFQTLLTDPATSTSVSSTTATSTTAPITLPVTTVAHTTTTRRTAHFTLAFDRDRLVIQSGTTKTFSYTLTNDGDARGEVSFPWCPAGSPQPGESLWLGGRPGADPAEPVVWPRPVLARGWCTTHHAYVLEPRASKTFQMTVAGGIYDSSDHLVPAPPGDTSFNLANSAGPGEWRLPVTITPPASVPLTVDRPLQVTTASGAQHLVDFTITNHLPFLVRYTDRGPCSHDVATPCFATTRDRTASGDLRRPPYATAVKPLYFTRFLLGANQVRSARAQVNGTAGLADGSSGPALPPGVYHFAWDGEKVTFTVTP